MGASRIGVRDPRRIAAHQPECLSIVGRERERRTPHHAAVASIRTFGLYFPDVLPRVVPRRAAVDASQRVGGHDPDIERTAVVPRHEPLGDAFRVELATLNEAASDTQRLLGVVGDGPGGIRLRLRG